MYYYYYVGTIARVTIVLSNNYYVSHYIPLIFAVTLGIFSGEEFYIYSKLTNGYKHWRLLCDCCSLARRPYFYDGIKSTYNDS